MLIRIIALISVFSITQVSFAKGSGISMGGGGGGKELKGFGLASIGVGGGNEQVLNPSPQMGLGNAVFGIMGVEFFPEYIFSLTLGVSGFLGDGTLDYDYIGKSNTHYRLGGEEFNWDGWHLYGGIKIHLLNFSALKLYGEGGGGVGLMNIRYSSVKALDTQGNDYQTEERDISLSGIYSEVGLELIPGKWGLRIAGRYTMNTTSNIEAFGWQAVRFEQIFGYLAFLRVID